MSKRKKLLRVAVAFALLVVAVPSAAMAYALDKDADQGGTRTEKAGCSLDPRILRLEPQLCSDNRGTTTIDKVPGPRDFPETQPVSSNQSDNEIAWWMVGIAVAGGGVAALIVGLRRGRPHALS